MFLFSLFLISFLSLPITGGPHLLPRLPPHGRADSLSAHSLPRSAQPPLKTTLAADCDPHLRFVSEALGCRLEVVNMWIGDERSTTSFHKGHKHSFLLPAPSHRCASRSQYPYSPITGEFELEIESPAILLLQALIAKLVKSTSEVNELKLKV
ncbi:hypothetical protein ACLB2K_066784 [Fragaria x ananassa]